MATAEFPELLSVRDDTSNDFTLRESVSLENARVVSTAAQFVIERLMPAEIFVPLRPVRLEEHTPAAEPPLFILNSALRT
jgi:hypothetical protein